MKLPINLYDLAYLAILPAAATMVGYKMARHGKYRESAPALVGIGLAKEDPTPWRDGCVWVHAVSVGEVIAARAMLPLLREKFAPLPILLTTHTETGQATARALPTGMADAIRYYPLDLSWVMRRYVKLFKPKIFIPMETELWPNALDIIAASGAKIFTLNGKISENSFRNYKKLHGLIRRPLSQITAFCVQTDADRGRVAALLGRDDDVYVTGNCKFDVDIPVLDTNAKEALASELRLTWPVRLIVAGSTHPGEEAIMLDAFEQVRQAAPDVHLMLVPRHPERFHDVWSLLQSRGISARRVSDGAVCGEGEPRVHLLDRMGMLTRLYGLAEVAVVAGSFVDGIGGHNILEPAAQGVPVVYGPDMKGQRDMARILSPANGGTMTAPHALGAALIKLLIDPEEALKKGAMGRKAYEANRGSALKNLQIISKYCDGDLS